MMNFSGGEIFVILLLALILVGPERLPQYAGQLARLVRSLKEMMSGAKNTLKEELGDEYAELQKFDPRQYDPRRIVREALLDDVVPSSKPAPGAAPRPASGAAPARGGAGASAHAAAGAAHAAGFASAAAEGTEPQAAPAPRVGAPFDDEAT